MLLLARYARSAAIIINYYYRKEGRKESVNQSMIDILNLTVNSIKQKKKKTNWGHSLH